MAARQSRDPKSGLTPKQEAFARFVADGKSQAAAYRLAFNTKTKRDDTVYVAASQLVAQDKISRRIAELRKEIEDKMTWARAQSLQVLAEIVHDPDAAHKDRIAAIKELNNMFGHKSAEKIDLNLPRFVLNLGGRDVGDS